MARSHNDNAATEPTFILGTAQAIPGYSTLHSVEPLSSVLSTAKELKIGALDTASAYYDAEEVIGNAQWEGEITTKVGGTRPWGPELERSLERLQRQKITTVLLHRESDLILHFREVLKLKREMVPNQIGAIGVSIYSPAMMSLALRHPLVEEIQFPISIANPTMLRLLPKKERTSTKRLVARSIFLRGRLLLPSRQLASIDPALSKFVANLDFLAEEWGTDRVKVICSWLKSIPQLNAVAVGVDSSSQLRQIYQTWQAASPLVARQIEQIKSLRLPPLSSRDARRW